MQTFIQSAEKLRDKHTISESTAALLINKTKRMIAVT